MFGIFLPRKDNFFEYFDKHVNVTMQVSLIFKEMISQEAKEREESAEKISILEKEADQIAHQCIEALHKTFITPFERDDIFRLITRLDDIVDIIEDTAARIVTYKLDTRKKPVLELIEPLMSSVEEIQKILTKLRKQVTMEKSEKHFLRIHQLENQADTIVRDLIGQLFDEEKDPILILKWKEIYENIEDSVDCCRSVANIVEGVMIENS